MTKNKYHNELQNCKTEQERFDFKRKNQSRFKLARQEACLSQANSVKFLAWHPATTVKGKALKFHDGTLKGKYICKYEDQNKELKEIECENDWVQHNFSIVAQAYAQQAGYACKKTVEGINVKGVCESMSGFVSIENENVTISFENHTIHMLKYIQKQTHVSKDEFQVDDTTGQFFLDQNGEKILIVRVVPPQWQDFSKDTKKAHYLRDNDVTDMVSDYFWSR